MTPRQLPIDFGHDPNYAPENYLIAPSNRDARGKVDLWPDWPGGMLALVGPAGSGKSHLARLFLSKSHGAIISAARLTLQDPPRLAAYPAVAVEDADQGVDEEALLHLYNMVREGRGSLLLTGREPPSRWAIALPDLRSRLATIALAEINPPDDELLAQLLVKLFRDRQLRIPEEAPLYLARRMERSFAQARALAEAIDKASLAGRRPVTLALARDVLARLSDEET